MGLGDETAQAATESGTASFTSKLRKVVGEKPDVKLKAAVDKAYTGFGAHSDSALLAFLTNPSRLASKYIAGLVEEPLNETLQTGVADNHQLWAGLEYLEKTAQQTGLVSAATKAGRELKLDKYGQALKEERTLATKAVSAAGKKFVIPALHGSEEARGAAAEIIAGFIHKLSGNLIEAGLNEETIVSLVNQASEKAVTAIKTSEAPNVTKAARALASEVIQHGAKMIRI